MKPKEKVLYFFPNHTTFIQRDLDMLSSVYAVVPFNLDPGKKYLLPFRMVVQFFFILRHIRSSRAMVCHFAGYSSWLPAMMGKWFRRPCLIIVAGSDASRFPSFDYGNFTKGVYGWFTASSLRRAACILPVHESLVYQKYDYFEGGKPAQGYTVFAKGTDKVPFRPVYYGYDASAFRPYPGISRISGSFISVGNISSSKVYTRKGYDLIIELARKRPDLKITLVGWDGKSKYDFPPNVTLKTFMKQEQLVSELSAHEFYFQLSIMEGFPNALAEAMLCGCIPIGSHVSGIPFIVSDTGYILHQRDAVELSALIDKALSDPRRPGLSAAARNRVAEHFTYDYRRNELVSLIEQYATHSSRQS